MVRSAIPEKVWQIAKYLDNVHLTGSRYFGNHSFESDWDFYTENNTFNVEVLRNAGFMKVTRSNAEKYAENIFVADVYSLIEDIPFRSIHVLMVNSQHMEEFDKIHTLLHSNAEFIFLNKRERKSVFNILLDTEINHR